MIMFSPFHNCKNTINIENLVNKARGDLAYTMIDTNSDVDEKALNEVENIIRVRVIGEKDL